MSNHRQDPVSLSPVGQIYGKHLRTYKKTTIWLLFTLIIGLAVSWQFDTGYEKIGVIGLSAIFLGGVIGCFRTGRFFTWSGAVEPSQLEGILGWSGAALMVAAILGFALRVALGEF